MIEEAIVEEAIVEEISDGLWPSIIDTYRKIKELKPEERSERARRFAILLTEYEKLMSYYLIMLDNDDFVG